jgi:hypothetical protein
MGMFLSRHTVKDAGMSALVYEGTYPGIAARFSNTGSGITHEIDACGALGKLNGKNRTGAMRSKVFGLDYTILFAVKKTGRWRCELGAALDNYLNLRENLHYVNNRNYYEFVSSIGPAFRCKYAFTWEGKPWEVNTSVFCPVVAALSTSYSAFGEQAGLHSPSFRTITENMKLTSWNKLNRFNWNTGVKMKIRKNSDLFLNYRWEYYRIKDINQVQSAIHSLTINYSFLL